MSAADELVPPHCMAGANHSPARNKFFLTVWRHNVTVRNIMAPNIPPGDDSGTLD